jgi:hypothetical protein
MNPNPDEWSVDVEGPNIIVAFAPGDETGRRLLTRHQARVLREQLRLAYLLAGRNRLTRDATAAIEIGAERGSLDALIGRESHVKPVDEDRDLRRLEAIEQTAGALSGMLGSAEGSFLPNADADGAAEAARTRNCLPERWDIRPEGDTIYFGVPASAADGELLLTQAEALAVGVLLIQLSRRRWIYEDNEELLDVLRLQELRSGSFQAITLEELLEALERAEAGQEPDDDGEDAE